MQRSNQRWFLIQTKPNAEHVARRNLENQEFTVFLPLQKLTRRKGNAFESHLRPLFPGYLFSAFNPDKGLWRKINSTRGVARLVRFGSSEPLPVPTAIMSALFERCDTTGIFQDEARLEAGKQIKIIQGPLTGLVATIADISPSQRVHILLEIMGQPSNTSIESAALRIIN